MLIDGNEEGYILQAGRFSVLIDGNEEGDILQAGRFSVLLDGNEEGDILGVKLGEVTTNAILEIAWRTSRATKSDDFSDPFSDSDNNE